MILDRVALPYSDIKDFSELPTPFACVSTDLVTNQAYVFRQGSLSLALRSTMSLPGIFDPVRWNGHIFADGGLMDNLPVDVAQSMGAELTIAVHLETAKVDPRATMSSFGVLGRSISVVIAANELRSMEKADVLISVPLEKFGSMQYNRADELIKLGYAAAESKAALLKTLSVDEPTWQAYLAQRASRRPQRPCSSVCGSGWNKEDPGEFNRKKSQEQRWETGSNGGLAGTVIGPERGRTFLKRPLPDGEQGQQAWLARHRH